MNIILETERLALREFSLSDADFIIQLLNTESWIKYIGDRNIKSTVDAENYLSNGPIKSYKENGFGLYRVELKTNQAPIGMCGIIKRDSLEFPDIGFALLPEHMGKGYGFEITKATLFYAKETLRIPIVLAITLPANQTCIKLLEKIGFKYVKRFIFPKESEELLRYST